MAKAKRPQRKHFLRSRAHQAAPGTKHRDQKRMHVKKDDLVEVLWGEDKGKRGQILQSIPSKGMVVVQGVNKRWKHLRRSQENPQGGRVERELPIPACKVKKVEE